MWRNMIGFASGSSSGKGQSNGQEDGECNKKQDLFSDLYRISDSVRGKGMSNIPTPTVRSI